MTDPIADMLTRVRNALMVNKETVEIPSSNMKKAIADIMLAEGFVSDVKLVEDGYNGKLVITLKYAGRRQPVINGLKRVSKPGLRTYAGVENMPQVMNGMGIAVISTNKGPARRRNRFFRRRRCYRKGRQGHPHPENCRRHRHQSRGQRSSRIKEARYQGT